MSRRNKSEAKAAAGQVESKRAKSRSKSTMEEKKAAPAKKSTMSKKTVDKTGDHPPPMRPMTAWTIFNGDKTKELAAEGKRKEAHSLSK